MSKRAQLLLVAALSAVLAGCGSDVSLEATPVTDGVAVGLESWRLASAQQARVDHDARIAAGLEAWRQATVERIQLDRQAEIERLRAELKVAGEQLRLQTNTATP